MEFQTIFLAATLIFFIFGLVAALLKSPMGAVLAFTVSLGSYVAWDNGLDPTSIIITGNSASALSNTPLKN